MMGAALNEDRMLTLRLCQKCKTESITTRQTCMNCGERLIVVVYSALDGKRITEEVKP